MAQTLRRTLALTPANAGMAAATQAETAASTVARGVAAVGLAAIGLIHLLDAPGTYTDTRYIFVLYLALIAGCLGTAALLLRAPRDWAGWRWWP